jgi:hypothetical protein
VQFFDRPPLLERLAAFDIDYRYAEGDTERLRPLARELIALAPDVVFAGERSAARAVKTLASNLPIVCPVFGPVTRDPITGIWAMINQAIDIAALVATELSLAGKAPYPTAQDGGDPPPSRIDLIELFAIIQSVPTI